MKEKLIYDSGDSRLVVSFDGEVITLTQSVEGLEDNVIYLYRQESYEAADFIKGAKRNDAGYQ